MLVLSYNGRRLNQDHTFKTSALRLNGIIGLGEHRHLTRIFRVIQSGLFRFTYGDLNAKVDFVGIQVRKIMPYGLIK